MWQSNSLTKGDTKTCDIFTTEWDANDSIWMEGHSDVFCPFVENGRLYCIIAGTSRYTMSGIRGNRQYGLIVYDDGANSWHPAHRFGPELINPMYFHNMASETDYEWAGDHMGGYISFIKKNRECYLFCGMEESADAYQIAALRLVQTK